MMCSSKTLVLATLMSVLLLHLCCESEAANTYDCCLRYTERKLPTRIIQNFTVQWANGGCDIDAIIFHTKARAVCADPRKHWVKHAVSVLSKRMRKM
ncbi:C-C motif chemokine 20 isoform X1 [Talpa occidentalis]|uniref:C-C motif chemokine 20 isoform X1 n=1 Tax=Talpa occidentalis TaxID=50954 RepID=UPI00188FEB15|nr:C-C motif chemokine 20 isoform X1 [Talpa occidentalis]